MAKGTNIVKMVSSPEVEEIRSRIYIVRGIPVMFDFDLARYYGIETRVLKQAVRRNRDSFPEDFMFVLSNEEANELIFNRVSQIVTPPNYNIGSTMPFVFTEAGVAMLSAVLKSSVAVNTRVQLMRGFVAMHQYLAQNGALMYRMDKLESTQQEQAEQLRAVMSGVDTILTELESRRDTSRPNPIGYEAIAKRDKE
ncbi:MAG: ORF6N domain-containing protein [Bacteroidales bacterium]|nr:ORF6N domain-containing protein [Candidatus Colicola equi]